MNNLRAFLADAVESGTWYYHAEYEKYNHVTRLPLEQKPGAGVSSGNSQPDRHLGFCTSGRRVTWLYFSYSAW